LKAKFESSVSRVETIALSSYGSAGFTLYSPTAVLDLRLENVHLRADHRRGNALGVEEARHDVAVQVEFESKGLKPGNHMSPSRVETRRFPS
jgi:hypothetical protein